MTLRIFFFLCLSLFAFRGQAQVEVTTVGTDFWFSFMNNFEAGSATLTVFISSEDISTGTIEMPLQGWSQNFATTPGVTTSIDIPIGAENFLSGVVEDKGIHVTSDNPISLYCINYAAYTSDGSRILPKQFLDIDYIVTGYRGLGGFGSDYVSELLIVSTEDGTEVKITPACEMQGGILAGVPYTVQLDQGETYLLKAENATLDVTGTLVTGTEVSGDCRPFAVFGGSQCPNIPDGCAACDHIFDQTIPTSVWGTDYFTVPLAGSTSYTYKVIASEDGTNVSVDGVPTYTLNAYESVEINDESAALTITSNAPISVVQFMEGTDCAGSGDPAMMALNSNNQTMDQVTFATVVSAIINNHNLNVVVPSTATNEVILDGTPIPPGSFTAFPGNPAFSYAQVDIAQGSHNLQCDQRFVAYTYGTGSAESYAYSTGAKALEPLEPVINVTCSDGQVTLQSDETYTSAWWSTVDNPEDTVFVGQPFIIDPPIMNQIYILHGSNFLSGCNEEEFFSVESPEELDVDILETSIDLCLYQQYTFSPTVDPAGSDYNYIWSAEGAFVVNDVENGIISPFESGYYYLDVSTFSGCSLGQDSVYVNIIGDDVTFFDALADPMAICDGDTVFLEALTGVNIGLDLFSTGVSATLWDDLEGEVLDNACGSMSGDALYFDGGADRWAETVDFDMSLGGSVNFAIQISNGVGACDGAEFGEDVLLQYSTNGGGGWTTMMTLYEGLYPDFQVIQAQVPIGAETAATRFRWIQTNFTAATEDIWMLDNISINNFGDSGNPYVWTSTQVIDNVAAQSTFSLPTEDAYFIVETTTSGCNLIDSVLVEVQSNFSLTITNDTTLCTPDDVQLNVTTSEPGDYTYLWDNGGSLSNVVVASPVANPIIPTTYTVDVTSSAGCVNSESVTIDVLSQAAPFIIADQTSICQGSVELEVDPGGDIENYVFEWSPAGLVDDPSAAAVTATPLSSTTFEVIVTDTLNDCTSFTDIDITVNQIDLELPPDTVLCDSEGLVIDYDFNPEWFHIFTWSNLTDLNNPFTAFPTVTVPDLNDVLVLTLEDLLLGCTVTDTMVVSTEPIDYTSPDALTLCPESTVQAEIIGDFIGITWTPSPNLNSSDPDSPIFSNDVDEMFYFNMLSDLGCSIDDSILIVVNLPAAFEIIVDDTLCDGSSIFLDNPVEGMTYLWNTTEVTEDIWVELAGVYSVTVTDTAGCVISDDVVIESFPLPAFEISGVDELCIGETTTLTAEITDVSYLWSNAGVNQSEDFTLAGQQVIWAEVTDIMGCVFRDSIDVIFRPPPSLLLSSAGAICEDTGIVITATAELVDFLWETNEISPQIEVFEEQYYTVTVTDPFDCFTTDSIFVEQIIFPLEQELDTFFCEGSYVVIYPELFFGFDVSWSNGSQADSIIINTQGTYQMILDNENCEKKYPFFVQFEANPELELSREGLFCDMDLFNGNGYPLFANSDGRVEWQGGLVVDSVFLAYDEGLYDAIAYSDLGCTTEASILVPNQCVPHVFAPNAFTPDDDGVNDLWKVIVSGEIDKYEISIYDRWGSKVFESVDPEEHWNGSVNGGDYYAADGIVPNVIVYEAWVNVPEIISEEKVGFVTIIR